MTDSNERLAVLEVHVEHNTEHIMDQRRRLTQMDQRINSTERWVAGIQNTVQPLPAQVSNLMERQDKTDRTMERIRMTVAIVRGGANTVLTTILVVLFLTGNLSLESAEVLLKVIGLG
jgi:septal ring factor EnvC (AmiA/AmiB activator)